jgi:hypothetical protein
MPEDLKPDLEQPSVEVEPPGAPETGPQEEDIGDFINRHVFERDSVFFEG